MTMQAVADPEVQTAPQPLDGGSSYEEPNAAPVEDAAPEGGESAASPWESPENPYFSKFEEARKQVDDMRQQLDGILPRVTEQERAEQQKKEAEFNQWVDGVQNAWRSSAMTEEEIQSTHQLASVGVAFLKGGPEFSTLLAQRFPKIGEVTTRDAALQFALKHLPDDASKADVKALIDELTGMDSGLLRYANEYQMDRGAADWVKNRRGSALEQRIASGADRVEGTNRVAGAGGLTDQEFINRWADENGGIASTRENLERARRLTAAGMRARARQ